MKYLDRTDAGRHLARELAGYSGTGCVVLALPNGGIPVGLEIARALGARFDLLFVSKITPETNSEIGYGAVSESGSVNLNDLMVRRLGLSKTEVDEGIRKTREKISSRTRDFLLRDGRADLFRKTVILTDDGLAGGYTMLTAIDAARERGASTVVVAVPTAPLSTFHRIERLADALVCPDVRDVVSFAVAEAYARWHDIDRDEALTLLRDAGLLE